MDQLHIFIDEDNVGLATIDDKFFIVDCVDYRGWEFQIGCFYKEFTEKEFLEEGKDFPGLKIKKVNHVSRMEYLGWKKEQQDSI